MKLWKKIGENSRLKTVFLAIAISLISGGVIIALSGNNPIEIYGKLLSGALGSQFAIASTIRWTTPVLFTGVAAAIGFRGGMFNIGVEGQLYIGRFAFRTGRIYDKRTAGSFASSFVFGGRGFGRNALGIDSGCGQSVFRSQ